MEEFIRPPELLIILLIVLVLFGGAKLPQLARNLGEAQRELRRGFHEGVQSEDDASKEKPKDSAQDTDKDGPITPS